MHETRAKHFVSFQLNLFLAFYLDVGILDVGGANPKGVLHIGAVGENAGVVGGVGDVGCGHDIGVINPYIQFDIIGMFFTKMFN